MNREIYKVFATQIVTSNDHPEGLLSNVSGFPKPFDSRDYNATADNPNGDGEIALLDARAEFAKEVVTLRTANNPTRVGWVVTLQRTSDGKEIDRFPFGGYPDMTPPEPEEETEPEVTGEGE